MSEAVIALYILHYVQYEGSRCESIINGSHQQYFTLFQSLFSLLFLPFFCIHFAFIIWLYLTLLESWVKLTRIDNVHGIIVWWTFFTVVHACNNLTSLCCRERERETEREQKNDVDKRNATKWVALTHFHETQRLSTRRKNAHLFWIWKNWAHFLEGEEEKNNMHSTSTDSSIFSLFLSLFYFVIINKMCSLYGVWSVFTLLKYFASCVEGER